MSDLDDFLATTLARQVEAEEALHNGDPGPRLAMWSTKDPVTVLGAVQSASGWDEVSRLFRWLGSGFSDCTAYRFELLAAGVSGDLAYIVGYEHTSVSWDGTPLEPYTLRVTHAYAGRTVDGRSSTATPTAPRSIRPLPPTHRQSSAKCGFPWGAAKLQLAGWQTARDNHRAQAVYGGSGPPAMIACWTTCRSSPSNLARRRALAPHTGMVRPRDLP
jgi:hypothetical protein